MATAASAAMSAAAFPIKKSTDFRLGSSSSRVAMIRASASVEKSGGGGGGSNAGGGCNSISSNGGGEGKKGVPNNSNYMVPLVEKATAGLTRPLAEILRDLNKRVPDKMTTPSLGTMPTECSASMPQVGAGRYGMLYIPAMEV